MYIEKNSITPRNRMCKLKDKRNPEDKKFVAYELKCKEDHCNAKYIGESGRTAGIRMMEHMKAL